MPVQLMNKIAATRTGRTILLTTILIILLIAPASANSIQFSGLSQVNKSIEIYNINEVAGGQHDPLASINSSALFYFQPGDSYMFEIQSVNNSTFLSDPLSFVDFIFSPGGEMLITFMVLAFLLILFLGGAFLLYSGRKK